MPAENSAVAIELVIFSFQSQRKEMPKNAQTTAQSHMLASKVMLKILQAKLQQFVNHELWNVQAGFRKGRGAWDQIASIIGSSKKQESSRKTSTLLTMPKPLTVWIVRNAAGRRSHPYRPLIRAFYWVVALRQNSRGRVSKEARGVCKAKGVCRGKGVCGICEGGEGFYSQGWGSHIRKKTRAQRWLVSKGSVSAPDWMARASCRLLIGRLGCRPVSRACLQHPLPGHVSTCPGMPRHASTHLTLPWPFTMTKRVPQGVHAQCYKWYKCYKWSQFFHKPETCMCSAVSEFSCYIIIIYKTWAKS